jgi:phasin family protein
MADQAVQSKTSDANPAASIPAANAAAPAKAEPVKAEPVKVEPVKAEPVKAEPVKAEPAKAEAAKAQPAAKPAPVAKAAAKKVKAAKPARKKPAPVRKAKAKPARPVAAIVKPARAGAKAIKTGVTKMTNQTRKAADTAAEQIKTVLGDANQRAKTAMEKSAKIVEELAELGRGNVEAIVASSKVAAKGVETLSQDVAQYQRKSFENASAAFKGFAEVKTATDFFRLQGDYARSAFDAAVAESARVSETVLKLAGDVAEPLTSRYTVAAERVKTLAA